MSELTKKKFASNVHKSQKSVEPAILRLELIRIYFVSRLTKKELATSSITPVSFYNTLYYNCSIHIIKYKF